MITAQLDETFRIGKVSFGGILREVNLSMVPDAEVGDYVLVHVGVAIAKINEEEAHKTMEYLLKTENLKEEINPMES